MRWRRWLGGALCVVLLAYVLIAFWPKAVMAAPRYSVPIDAQPLVVSKVLSGDTLLLVSDHPGPQIRAWGTVSARLIGLDAPNFGLTYECFAVEAQARLAELLPTGTIAWVTTDATKRDDNGRWLTYIWTADGRLVNQLLAVSGYARAIQSESSDPLRNLIEYAGGEAAARSGGLWGACR